MVTTLIVNGSPYGSELPYNALRLAAALLVKEHWVELFFLGDGVHTARRGQDPRGAHASLEDDAGRAARQGRRGHAVRHLLPDSRPHGADVVDGVRLGTIHDLADLVARSDRVVSF